MEVKTHHWKRLHLWATWLWLLLVIPTLLWWSTSIKWIVFMSIYACIMGHFSAWQSVRAEESGESNV